MVSRDPDLWVYNTYIPACWLSPSERLFWSVPGVRSDPESFVVTKILLSAPSGTEFGDYHLESVIEIGWFSHWSDDKLRANKKARVDAWSVSTGIGYNDREFCIDLLHPWLMAVWPYSWRLLRRPREPVLLLRTKVGVLQKQSAVETDTNEAVTVAEAILWKGKWTYGLFCFLY